LQIETEPADRWLATMPARPASGQRFQEIGVRDAMPGKNLAQAVFGVRQQHQIGVFSLEFVPNTTPAALLIQMAMLDQFAEMLLQRVSADPRQFDCITNRDAPVLAGKFDDLQ
jgi:hypothetical protein